MATEEVKKQNLVRMYKLTIQGLARGMYDLFGDASFAIMNKVGDELLTIMEKEMGLEIGGQDANEILQEISRLFVDEFGFAGKIEVIKNEVGEKTVKVSNCGALDLSNSLRKAGIEHPFTCPIMNTISAAIRRNGGNLTGVNITACEECKGSLISFKFGGA